METSLLWEGFLRKVKATSEQLIQIEDLSLGGKLNAMEGFTRVEALPRKKPQEGSPYSQDMYKKEEGDFSSPS